jgi:hypothetical protein
MATATKPKNKPKAPRTIPTVAIASLAGAAVESDVVAVLEIVSKGAGFSGSLPSVLT